MGAFASSGRGGGGLSWPFDSDVSGSDAAKGAFPAMDAFPVMDAVAYDGFAASRTAASNAAHWVLAGLGEAALEMGGRPDRADFPVADEAQEIEVVAEMWLEAPEDELIDAFALD